MGALNDLLAVQTTDIELAQAIFRLAHLPERERFSDAEKFLREVTARRDQLIANCAAIETEITTLEADSAALDAQIVRLEKQLKTVIAPREAEALQHEIADRRRARSAHDDRELELMEELEAKRATLEDCAREIIAATQHRETDAKALKAAKAVVDAEIARLTEQRSAQSLVVPSTLLEAYDRKRKSRPDGAVATLHGPTCGSCHMDLARTELDALHALAEGEHPECPQCGCFIVL